MTRYSVATRRVLPAGRCGLLALSGPIVIIGIALAGMAGTSSGGADPSMPLVGGLLFLLAVPTTWLFEVLGMSGQPAVAAGVATSLPLWFLVGSGLAVSATSWGMWARRYVVVSVGWAVVAILLIAGIGSLTG